MKLLLLKCAALIIAFYFTLMLLARLIITQVEPPRDDVFISYSEFMPGQSDDSLKACETYYIEMMKSYANCNVFSGGTFHWIRIYASNGVIDSASFYPLPGAIRLPDLLRWFGGYTKLFHGKNTVYVRWPNGAVASFWRWHGMMSEPFSVFFRSDPTVTAVKVSAK